MRGVSLPLLLCVFVFLLDPLLLGMTHQAGERKHLPDCHQKRQVS